jgi:hypothetical protein
MRSLLKQEGSMCSFHYRKEGSRLFAREPLLQTRVNVYFSIYHEASLIFRSTYM